MGSDSKQTYDVKEQRMQVNKITRRDFLGLAIAPVVAYVLQGCGVDKYLTSSSANENITPTLVKPGLLIPLGRLNQNNNKIQLFINTVLYEPKIIEDGNGGYWYKLALDALKREDKVILTIKKLNDRCILLEKNIDKKRWIVAGPLIDSDNPQIVSKAIQITEGYKGNNEKAHQILQYVVDKIAFQLFAGMHYQTASMTLKRGSGICVNHSRLFVALCRAAGIPARTVSGALLDDQGIFSHHEWAEFYDDNQSWHPLEPTFSNEMDLVDLRRFDLIYNIESNPIYPFIKGWETDSVKLENGDISIFCPNWALQEQTGRMDYTVMNDNSPKSVEIKIEYELSKYI